MARLGVLCLPIPSQLTLFLSFSQGLSERAHEVVFFGIPQIEERVRRCGFEFRRLEPRSAPSARIPALLQEMADADGWKGIRLQLEFDRLRSEAILASGPEEMRRASIDGLIVSQAEIAAGSVAEHLGLPWISIATGLCLNSEPRVPPFFTGWDYGETPLRVLRNELAYGVSKLLTKPVQKLINQYRRGWKLKPTYRLDETFSSYAQICQHIREFDFPRKSLPTCFHYVGSLGQAGPVDVRFPWDALDGRPMIYACLGTIVNKQDFVYRRILEACADLNCQLVLSLGGADDVEKYEGLSSNAIVVRFAPQRELLKRARLTISHAGLNTTLESLAEGVPMVVIPLAVEPQGVAARIRWTQTGEVIPVGRLTTKRLRRTVLRVMEDERYRLCASKMKAYLAHNDGRTRALDIVEQVIKERRAVTGV